MLGAGSIDHRELIYYTVSKSTTFHPPRSGPGPRLSAHDCTPVSRLSVSRLAAALHRARRVVGRRASGGGLSSCAVACPVSVSLDRRFYISDYVAHKLYGTSDTFLSVVSGMVYYTDGAAARGQARPGCVGERRSRYRRARSQEPDSTGGLHVEIVVPPERNLSALSAGLAKAKSADTRHWP